MSTPASFFETKNSPHSFVDHYWHMRDVVSGQYPLYTTVKWGFVFSEYEGIPRLQLIGPRTLPSSATYRAEEYFWGIVVNANVNLAGYSKKDLVNKVINIPVKDRRFLIDKASSAFPAYEDLDDFTQLLITQKVLYATPVVATSHRDTQRKVKLFTGLTPKQVAQAERVDTAISLLGEPLSLAAIALQAGFSDQAHMTRDFKRLVGYSPAEIRRYFGS